MAPGPLLYQLNTRIYLNERAQTLGRPTSLDDVEDQLLDKLASKGFGWLWALGVWQTGERGRAVSRSHKGWQEAFARDLPDLRPEDIIGSPFAIKDYALDETLSNGHGGRALDRLRARCHVRGLKLMLDFVPNHMALDHPWVQQHPERFIEGSAEDLLRAPQNFIPLDGRILAHGRDPHFPGWPDTLQLDYARPKVQEAMMEVLDTIAQRCDGVRCDMAMLLLPEVFERTWGSRGEVKDFWSLATARIKGARPDFRFMAEVYWDLEWALQQRGFDYTYDKRLYDRLLERRARPVRDHLRAAMDYQRASARFLENHDEPRIARALPEPIHRAAAVLTLLSPGLGFIHEGQLEGWTMRANIHLGRRQRGPDSPAIEALYAALLLARQRAGGRFTLLEPKAAWTGNSSFESFIGLSWRGEEPWLLAVVNYSDHQSQCYLPLPFEALRGRTLSLEDRLSQIVYKREGARLLAEGLYLDMPAWGCHVFEVWSSLTTP